MSTFYTWDRVVEHLNKKFRWRAYKQNFGEIRIFVDTRGGTVSALLTRRFQLYGWRLVVTSSDATAEVQRTWKTQPNFTELMHALHRSVVYVEPVPTMFRMQIHPVAVFLTIPHPNNPDAREGIDVSMSGVEVSDWDRFVQQSTPLSKSIDAYHTFYHDIVEETGIRLEPCLRNGSRIQQAFEKHRNMEIYLQPHNPNLGKKHA